MILPPSRRQLRLVGRSNQQFTLLRQPIDIPQTLCGASYIKKSMKLVMSLWLKIRSVVWIAVHILVTPVGIEAVRIAKEG